MRFLKTIFLCFASGLVLVSAVYLFLTSRQETITLSDEIRSNAPGKFIRLEHGLVHYLHKGEDSDEVVLFIHGGGIAGMEVWQKNIPFFLEKEYQVLAYDLYGRGYSERPLIDYTPEIFVQQLSRLVDSLNISGPINIISMSMGSMIALDYTTAHPERVKKIIFLDPALTGDFRPSVWLKIPIVSKLLMTAYWYPNAVENQRKEFFDQQIFEQYKERLKYFMNFSGYKHVNYSTWMHTLVNNKIHLMDSLKPASVLLIYGEHDPYFAANAASVYKNHYPSLQHHSVRAAGHMPHFEKPEEVNNLIYSFLKN